MPHTNLEWLRLKKRRIYSSMKNLVSFGLFESQKKIAEIREEEFRRALENTPEGRDFSKWFNYSVRRTGRIYITSREVSIPGTTWFEKYDNREEWYYIYSGSGRTYGQQIGTLKDLFRLMVEDVIRKNRPSGIDINTIKKYMSDGNSKPGNLPDSLSEIYDSAMKEFAPGIITDFSFLGDLEIIKRLKEIGSEVNVFDKSVTIQIFSNNLKKSLLYGEAGEPLRNKIWFRSNHDQIRIIPALSGVSTSKQSGGLKQVKIGLDSKSSIVDVVNYQIEKLLEDFTITINSPHATDSHSTVLADIIRKIATGEPLEKYRQEIDHIVADLVDPLIKEDTSNVNLVKGIPGVQKIIQEMNPEMNVQDLSKGSSILKRFGSF
jgi:hypothetical protein